MATPRSYISAGLSRSSANPLFVIAVLWGSAALIALTFLYTEFAFGEAVSKLYLVPWCLGAGVVILAPSVYLTYKGRFDPFHPLVFPAWSYFFPGFVMGGLALASGLSQPYFLTFIQDEHYNLPLTFVYVMLGYAGLTIGYVLPVGRKIGEKIASRLPSWEWSADKLAIPGLLLLAAGFANTMLAFGLGIIGFQKVDKIGIFDGTIFLFTLFWLEGSLLLWLLVFKAERLAAKHLVIIGLLLAAATVKTAFQGNRGGILQILILIGFAFVLSRKKITLKHNLIGGVLVTLALIAGMIYGTAFRSIKGSQERASIGELATTVATTGEHLLSLDVGANLSNGFAALAERIDSVSSLAVIVSNYEALAPYEEAYGINDNIQTELTTFFIPRMFWPDKPISIEPKKYADLYFNYSENSFAMTPMGDLLRNFGPIGIPIGMLILGLIIRVMYSALVEGQAFSYWRVTLFFMIFSTISYEGTYGLIVPYLLKVLVIAMLGLLLIRFIIGSGRPKLPQITQ